MFKKPNYEELEHQVKNLKKERIAFKRLEEAWKESEELCRISEEKILREKLISDYIVDNTPAGIAFLDNDFVLRRFNKEYAELIRNYSPYTPEEAMGMSYFDYVPNSRSQVEEWFKKVRDTGQVDTLHGFKLVLERDGQKETSYWDTSIAPMLGTNANANGILILTHNVTVQKQVEEDLKRSVTKYRSMMESITDPLYICSHKFTMEYMNPAMIKRLGRDATGETCYKVLHCMGHKCDWCVFNEVAKGKTLETTIVSPLDDRHYRVTNMPIHNKDGTISKMTIYRDITKYIEAVAEKNKAQEQLNQAQKMESIGRLAEGVAHDYNNALTAIIGYTELAMKDADPKGHLHDNLNEILKASTHTKDITQQLLTFVSKQTISPKVINLNTTIEVILKMLRSLIGEDIDLAWFPGNNLWPVKIDPSQIDQILATLCVNAKDAIAGVGKITVETTMVVLDEAYCSYNTDFIPGGFVMMAISDNGCGMEKKILDNIFEPFFTTKDLDKGMGLGLATVYGIVKQNNGFINVYSEKDKGTVITIYLPRNDGTAIDSQKEIADESPQGRGETILLVEDEISILKLAKKVLNGLGYKVLAANSPKGAIQVAKEYKNKIRLILTDVVMPEMYGDELVHSLQSLYPDIKHIFMSGYTAKAIAHHGVLDEGVTFIQKPFSQISLAQIVRKVLDENE